MGITGGGYRFAAEALINGVSYPVYTASVDVNVYSMASMLKATIPIDTNDTTFDPTKVTDISALAQANPLLPFAIRVGYEPATSPADQIALFQIEQGYVDETTDTYDANELEIVGRSTASLFQDARIASPNSYNLRGDQLVSQLFAKAGIPVTIGGTSTAFVGKGYTQTEYLRAYRARSEWDEMTDAALKDGFVLQLHNGQGYYGPPPASAPKISYEWGQDLDGCKIVHAARRSHDIVVTVDSYIPKTQQKITATYSSRGAGGAGAATSASANGENFRFFVSGLDNNQLRARAKAIWTDLVKREFIATLKIYPDVALLKTIATNGANFNVQLGNVKPSHALLYQVRKATVTVETTDDEAELYVTLVCANHDPVQGQGEYE